MVVKPVHTIGKYGGTWRRGFTGPGDGENGNRIVSTDKILFWDYTGYEDPALHRQGLEGQRRRAARHDHSSQGHEVVGRGALHGQTTSCSGTRRSTRTRISSHAQYRLHRQREAGDAQEDRRPHGGVRVPRPQLSLRGHPGRQHGHGRRSGHVADVGAHDGRLHARALPEAVSAEVRRQGGPRREGQGGRVRRLGDLDQEPLGLAPQPGAARRWGRGRRSIPSTPPRGFSSATPSTSGWTRRATSFHISTASA